MSGTKSQLTAEANRDRPASENPGGCECERCGCIFIGEEWHSFCGVCINEVKRELVEAQNG